jgi:hypothetical protein
MEIHSTADAERQIAVWRNRSGCSFWEYPSSSNGEDHSYEIQVDNGLLNDLRIVPPTFLTFIITMRRGNLHHIILSMVTGSKSKTTAAVGIFEWFGSGTPQDIRVNASRKPWSATVDFSSVVPEPDRTYVLAVNTLCLVRPGGCKSAADLLPGVWSRWPPLRNKQPLELPKGQ